MARHVIRWTDNGLGLWKSDDGQYGIFPESNGRFRLQVSTGPNPWEWELVGTFPTWDDASDAAREMSRGTF